MVNELQSKLRYVYTYNYILINFTLRSDIQLSLNNMKMNIPNCCVGTTLHENCHQTKYTRKQGLKKLTDIENDAIHLLQMRTNHIFPPETSTICLHHE